MNNTLNDLLRLQKQLEPLRQYQHLTKTLNPISPSLSQTLRLMEQIQKMTPIYEQASRLNNISGIDNMTRIGFLEKFQRLLPYHQTNALGNTLASTVFFSAKNMTYWQNLQKYFSTYQQSLLKNSSQPPSPKDGNFAAKVRSLETNNHDELLEKTQDLVASTVAEISQVLKDVNVDESFIQETDDHFDSISKVIQQDLTAPQSSSNEPSPSSSSIETTFSANVLTTYQEIQTLLCHRLNSDDMLALLSFAGFFLTVETAGLSVEKIIFFRSTGSMLLFGYIALRFMKPKGKDN